MIMWTSKADINILLVQADKGGFKAAFSKDSHLREYTLLTFTMVTDFRHENIFLYF